MPHLSQNVSVALCSLIIVMCQFTQANRTTWNNIKSRTLARAQERHQKATKADEKKLSRAKHELKWTLPSFKSFKIQRFGYVSNVKSVITIAANKSRCLHHKRVQTLMYQQVSQGMPNQAGTFLMISRTWLLQPRKFLVNQLRKQTRWANQVTNKYINKYLICFCNSLIRYLPIRMCARLFEHHWDMREDLDIPRVRNEPYWKQLFLNLCFPCDCPPKKW
jgi:hypothetical protein